MGIERFCSWPCRPSSPISRCRCWSCRCGHCGPSRRACLYRCDSCGRHALQYFLLGICLLAYGNKRPHLAGLRSARPRRGNPSAGQGSRCRRYGGSVAHCAAISVVSDGVSFIEATPEVERLASLYFRICIWGAPAVLGLYAFSGWFIGMQNARFPMWIAITQNVVNIAASLLLVYVAGLKVEGVALGTLIAQYAGLFMAIVCGGGSISRCAVGLTGGPRWETGQPWPPSSR